MSDYSFASERPLPEGVRDLLFADTAAWRGMEAGLRALWSTWGYREITLPMFEYASTLATDVGAEIEAEMYRFFDRHGRTLALRPDLTLPTARVVGTRLFDRNLPLRLSYVGSVFRYEPPRAGRQHEFTQAGVELIGAPGVAADAEIVALAGAALRTVGLPAYRIALGHVGFYRGLAEALALPPRLQDRLHRATATKAEGDLSAVLAEAGVTRERQPQVTAAVLALPLLTGGAPILEDARQFCLNSTMTAALDDLVAVATRLAAYGVADVVTYDLAEARDLGYYTGITFEGFAPGLGFSLISGGRYDSLISHFGPPLPAVGWAMTLDRVLEAREAQGVVCQEPAAAMLLSTGGRTAGLIWATAARERGLAVEVDLLGLTPDALWRAAQARHIPRAAWFVDDTTLQVHDARGERLLLADAWEEVAVWCDR